MAAKKTFFLMDVRVKAGASAEGITGKIGSRYKISVQAPPEKGKANKRLQKLLGNLFKVPAGNIEIISGHTNRDKHIVIGGVSPAAGENCLSAILSSESKR